MSPTSIGEVRYPMRHLIVIILLVTVPQEGMKPLKCLSVQAQVLQIIHYTINNQEPDHQVQQLGAVE